MRSGFLRGGLPIGSCDNLLRVGLSSFHRDEPPGERAPGTQGTWHAIEILIITIGVGLGLRSLSSMPGESSSLYLGMLTFVGLIRLFAGFQNLGVILQVIT